MTLNVDQLAAEAMLLPLGDRAILVDKLVESLDITEPSDLQRLWAAEAARRRDEIRSGRVQPIDGEHVMGEARSRVGR
jgi:putative addiction module component (TIGR02574 family)